jgi:hypothetical protein
MPYTVVATEEPTQIIAGDSASWTITTENSDFYASNGFVLSYSLRGTAGSYNVTSSADGDDHLIEIPAATSALWENGTYEYQAVVTKAATSERYTIKTGEIKVVVDLASIPLQGGVDTRHDGRSYAKKILDAIDATMLGKVTDDAQTMQSAGTMIIYMSATQLMDARGQYEAIYNSEEDQKKIDKGDYPNNVHFARFRR